MRVYAAVLFYSMCLAALFFSYAGDHNYIRCSGKFFSLSVRGGGGPVLALPFSEVGKLATGHPTINGHSAAVYDTAWNPFNDNLLATGSDDTTVKLWSIPDGGLTENMKEPLVRLHMNQTGRISLIRCFFNIRLASASHPHADHTFRSRQARLAVGLEPRRGPRTSVRWQGPLRQAMGH